MPSWSGEQQRVEERSRVFRKELGLFDLALAQVVYIVGSSWVGIAAKLGPAHVVMWLTAMAAFYLPQAALVIHMSRIMPLEGGIYQWIKLGWNDTLGFMVAWNLWVYSLLNVSVVVFAIPTDIGFIGGSATAWIPANKLAVLLISTVVVGLIALATIRGLSVGKWISNTGGLMTLTAYAILIALPVWAVWSGRLSGYHPIPLAVPALSAMNLALLGNMAVGGLSGFEYVAILAGESRNPAKSIGRSVFIAGPVIALMFILGTSSVQAFVGSAPINIIGSIPQTFRLALESTSLGAVAIPFAIILIMGRQVAGINATFLGITRLPMVAGWDDLLPSWFTRLHHSYRTPVNAIVFVTAAAMLFLLGSMWGVSAFESQILMNNASLVLYGTAYLALFLLPLAGKPEIRSAIPLWVKVTAVPGAAISLLMIVLSVYPIVDVVSHVAFLLKIGAVVLCTNCLGYLLHRRRALR